MSRQPPKDPEALRQRLDRLSAALGPPPRPVPPPAPPGVPRGVSTGGLALGLGLIAVGIGTGQPGVTVIGVLLVVLGAALRLGAVSGLLSASLPAQLAPKDPTRAHIGMGADVAEGAIIEPGATVEMGATVGAGAVVKPGATVEMGATVGAGAVVNPGAVVRMGATVHERAVIEEGAVIGWGVDVMAGATVGQGAVVGAGATVQAGAQVPPGTRLAPGSTWSSGLGARAEPKPVPPAAVQDPRESRILAACERIEAELRQAPEQVRELLGASGEPARGLRETCLGLLRRERTLRGECSPESLAFLEKEKAELERRGAEAPDPAVRRSLTQAVGAIDDQLRQRGLMRQSAERLDAELTRLMWTLDGMGAQLVRLRTAGAEVAGTPDLEMLHSMQQLHDEIDAIADALEHVAREDMQPVAPIDDAGSAPSRVRSRE
jgi:carbonic anhydrase/acetyltransferase-like protein (isoleucine patch superfamily)